VENLAHTGIRSPDLTARRESLYRLSYPGSLSCDCNCQILYMYLKLSTKKLHKLGKYQGIFIWLEVNTHPEGSATGHLDTSSLGFPLSSRCFPTFPIFQVTTACSSCCFSDVNSSKLSSCCRQVNFILCRINQ
jgi:hypothetical protein